MREFLNKIVGRRCSYPSAIPKTGTIIGDSCEDTQIFFLIEHDDGSIISRPLHTVTILPPSEDEKETIARAKMSRIVRDSREVADEEIQIEAAACDDTTRLEAQNLHQADEIKRWMKRVEELERELGTYERNRKAQAEAILHWFDEHQKVKTELKNSEERVKRMTPVVDAILEWTAEVGSPHYLSPIARAIYNTTTAYREATSGAYQG